VKDTTPTQGSVVVENIAFPGGVIQVISKVRTHLGCLLLVYCSAHLGLACKMLLLWVCCFT
jgi:hypothetical protein